jgi:hypothetical protein
MRYLKYLALVAVLIVPAAFAQGQVAVGVGVGFGPHYAYGPPVCQWGYYDYYPYACAPYGYYGPEWFSGGIFIGAGPWFHGPAFFNRGFHGGFRGRAFVRNGFGVRGRGFEGRSFGRAFGGQRGFVGRGSGFRASRGGFSGGGGFRGGSGFHAGGGFHGGGGRR